MISWIIPGTTCRRGWAEKKSLTYPVGMFSVNAFDKNADNTQRLVFCTTTDLTLNEKKTTFEPKI